MDNDRSFLDELLDEVEKKERSLHLAHVDMVLNEIRNLEGEIANNFKNTDLEKQYLDQWVLQKNSKLQEKIEWMTKKLEAFMYEQGADVKTIDLPNGKLLRRKQPDKIEIVDMDKFIQNADSSMLTVVPESVRPDLRKVMAYYKRRLIPPVGARLVIGEEKFSIKLNNNKENNNGESSEIGVGDKSADSYKTAV